MAQKIVEFFDYCYKCEYKEIPENESPCWECLDKPVNEDSHKPINFVEEED